VLEDHFPGMVMAKQCFMTDTVTPWACAVWTRSENTQ